MEYIKIMNDHFIDIYLTSILDAKKSNWIVKTKYDKAVKR